MSLPESFTISTYSLEGEQIQTTTVDTGQLEESMVAHFQTKFTRLSGDLELPFEEKLPGDVDFIDYRIGSDLNGAYVLYYFHDEVVFATLLLSGTDDTQETELMQVFKFLLLDSQDAEEPTEEEIEAVLASDQFDFPKVESRPAAFQVRLSPLKEDDEACDHIRRVDQHLAVAFFERTANTSTE